LAVASEHPLVSDSAIAILESGGSAADAAVTALLVAGVVQPVSSGLGGGGMALYWDATKRAATLLDFSVTAPIGLKPEDHEPRPATGRRRGALVGVPGEAAGLGELHRRWGKLGLGDVVRPAITLARQGFAIGPHMHRALRWNRRFVRDSSIYAPIFGPEDRLLARGARATNPALGRTLEKIAGEGFASCYRDDIQSDIVAAANAKSGQLAAEDFARYQVIERKPLAVDFAGRRVLTAAPPSAGGLLLVQTLAMHRPEELEKLGYASGAYFHVLAEGFRAATSDRMRMIGDPAFVRVDMAELTSTERLAARRRAIALDRTAPPAGMSIRDDGTAALVVVDAEGSVAILTTSLGNMFGAQLVTGGGFPLNDGLAAFTPDRERQRFGAGKPANRARGGARPTSSYTPTLVLQGDEPVLALAASGGLRIPEAVTQTLLAQLIFGRTAADAASDGRIHAPPGGGLTLDPGADDALRGDLAARGELVMTRPDYSAVELVVIDRRAGRLTAASDARKGGAARVR
jgi:gamma-glutamyltranspeptidase/glutathione hydrolase